MRQTADASDRATFTIGRREGWSVIAVSGELDLYTAPRLEAELSQVVSSRSEPQVAIDLSALKFCDSSGLNAILRAWKGIKAVGGRLVLLRPTPRVANVLNLTGLDRRIEICDPPSNEAALSS
jgi:anti-sigma B factor antagonist